MTQTIHCTRTGCTKTREVRFVNGRTLYLCDEHFDEHTKQRKENNARLWYIAKGRQKYLRRRTGMARTGNGYCEIVVSDLWRRGSKIRADVIENMGALGQLDPRLVVRKGGRTYKVERVIPDTLETEYLPQELIECS